MRLFTSPTPSSSAVGQGPAVSVKPSRWKRFFTKRNRSRSPSLSSALSESFNELSSVNSYEDIRVIGHVEEINLRDPNPSSSITKPASTVFTRKASVESFGPIITRETFLESDMFDDAEEDNEGEVQQFDTMMPVYVDALDREESLEVKDAMEITVVAEVDDDLPAITEEEKDGYFVDISSEEFVPPTRTARKFILLTFIILLTSATLKKPLRIDSRWILDRAAELLRSRNISQKAVGFRRNETKLNLRFISYCAF